MTAVHPEYGLLDATARDLGVGIEWKRIHRGRPPAPLNCRGCGTLMSAKVSKLGLRFFAHRTDASDCPSAGETLAHRLLKVELAAAIRDAGWDAELEVPGNGWRADVLASAPDGSARIAFEAQLASATIEDLRGRTATMGADGVGVCWVTDRDVPWVTHVPSARVRRPDPDPNGAIASHGQPALVVIDGHARFDPHWCSDRSRCSEEDGYGRQPVPCPGHGQWEQGPPLPLTQMVAAICSDSVRPYRSLEQIWVRNSRHRGGSWLWVTRVYRDAAHEQQQATEAYERWEELQARKRAEHGQRIVALLARQQALRRPTIEWMWNEHGVYPTLGEHGPRFAMGVPVMVGTELRAVICPVASRVTAKLAGWFATATIVVADDIERERLAAVCRRGQRFKVIDPGPLPTPSPARDAASPSSRGCGACSAVGELLAGPQPRRVASPAGR